MMRRALLMSLLAMTCSSAVLVAQPNPVVAMSVTLPDGKKSELTAPESGLAEVTLADGTKIGVRPTILDSKPWSRVLVTFFRMPTATHASEEIGSVELRTGGPAVAAKGVPGLKVGVTTVSEPAHQPSATTGS